MITSKQSASIFRVKSTSLSRQYRRINLLDHNGKTVQIRLHRFAIVGQGDDLFIDPKHTNYIYVLSAENPEDKIQVSPHFEKPVSFRFGDSNLKLLIKEIVTPSELLDYEFLEGFHYKTSTAIVSEEKENGNIKSQKAIGGRKSVLMCYLRIGTNWQPAGYIELQMPLFMVKPRHILFDNAFSHPTRPIQWDSWNLESRKQYVNLIVRIARIVISPDLRGLGLTKFLIQAAKEHAIERWHINGRRPLFMEISAEMLKYMDFVSSSGLRFIDNTEGNLERVHMDLVYMQRGYDASTGIMSLQRKYLTALKDLSKDLNKDFDEVLGKLKKLLEDTNGTDQRAKLNELEPDDWYLFKTVLRFPIPYHLCGLDDAAQKYIDYHASAKKNRVSKDVFKIQSVNLKLDNISINSSFNIPDSLCVRAIKNCFGIEGDILNSKLVGPVSIVASGGNIILIAGPNGSGKSLLLRAIDPEFYDSGLSISINNGSSYDYSVAWLREIDSDKPLIEYFGEKWGIESSVSALNQAGLSEAFIYLKPYKLLSRGQQYRARLAELLIGNEPIWLVDEFCSDLDPFAAKIVANNLRKQVIKTGRIAIIAAANHTHYLDALRPTRVIVLRQNAAAKVMTYKEYIDEFHIKPY